MSLIERVYAWRNPITLNADTGGANDLDTLIGTIVGWVSLIVGFLAFIYLVYAGILYITAAGDSEKAKKGQQGVIYAIIGIVVAVAAYTIVGVIANKAGNLST